MEDGSPPRETREDPVGVHRATQNAILFGILPLWIVPGFLDYLMHRKSSIESTSGTHESLIHALQMTSIGIPTLMALVFEVNAPAACSGESFRLYLQSDRNGSIAVVPNEGRCDETGSYDAAL